MDKVANGTAPKDGLMELTDKLAEVERVLKELGSDSNFIVIGSVGDMKYTIDGQICPYKIAEAVVKTKRALVEYNRFMRFFVELAKRMMHCGLYAPGNLWNYLPCDQNEEGIKQEYHERMRIISSGKVTVEEWVK